MLRCLAQSCLLLSATGCATLDASRVLAENRQIQSDAPIKAEVSGIIDAPIETVWSVFAAVGHWPEWNEDTQDATLTGRFAAGGSLEYGGATRHHLTLAVVDPPRLVSFYGKYLGFTGVTVWQFDPLGRARTRVTAKESSAGTMISLLYSNRQLEQHLTGWLNSLKSRSEASR